MITQELAQEARRDIFSFLVEVLNFLELTIREPYGDGGLLITERMVKPLQEAWKEFDADFDRGAMEMLAFSTPSKTLQAHGLYGAQLKAKLQLFRIRLSDFVIGKRTKKLLFWLIDAIDVALESIAEALGLDGAFAELKELLRNSIDVE